MAPSPDAGAQPGEAESDTLLPNVQPHPNNDLETNSAETNNGFNGTDGTLAWLVASANFLINFTVVGLGRMSGILYVVFMETFHVDRKTASIPFIVQQAARNLFGPIVGILGQKYGVRSVVFVGGVIGAVSATVCYYATNLYWITIMWGLVFGLCTALTTTLNQIPIDQYFKKHRTTAGGFAFSGGCVGAFIFPVVIETLIKEYKMDGTFLAMAGILLAVIPCSLLLKEPAWVKLNNKNTQDQNENVVESNQPLTIEKFSYNTFRPLYRTVDTIGSNINFQYLREKSELVYQLFALVIPSNIVLDDSLLETQWPGFDTVPIVNELEELHNFLKDPRKPINTSETGTIVDELTRSVHVVAVTCKNSVESIPKSSSESDISKSRSYEDNKRWLFMSLKLRELLEMGHLDVMSNFPTSIHATINEVLQQLSTLNECIVRWENAVTTVVMIPKDEKDIPRKTRSRRKRQKNSSNSFITHINTAVQMHKNPLFLLICLCRGVFMLTFIPMVTIVVDFAMDKGLKRDTGKYVIASLSLGDLLGRLCLGWITDSGILGLPNYMLSAMILLGISTATLPMMYSEISLMPAILVFGMLQGSLFIRHQTLVSNYMKSHEQAIGMGFINLLSGLLGFALPYYIGYFRDTLGSYDRMFYINGGICALVGLIWIFEPCIVRFSHKEKAKFNKMDYI